MFAGHLGAGLILKTGSKSTGLGALFFAAMFLDFVLWLLILCGVEFLQVPAEYHRVSDLRFDFPYSHGLLASIGWSCAGFFIARLSYHEPEKRLRAAPLISAAVFSHFVLDWLVHVPELPVFGRDSIRLGLGLWKHLPFAWTIEAGILAAGLWLYLRNSGLSRGRRTTLMAVMGMVMLMTILGQASKALPPQPAAMAMSSLITIALLVAFGWWIERTAAPIPEREGKPA